MTGEEEIHVTNRLGNGASLMPSPNDCTYSAVMLAVETNF